jgi:HEAT repeat protein
VRALAVKKLAERNSTDDVSLFTQAARDPVAIVRAEAMAALGRSQDARVVDLLGEALADPDEAVQQHAAAALASFKTDKARSYLTLQYSRRGRSTRIAIVDALKGTNLPGAMASVVVAEASALWERNVKVLADGTLPERVGAAEDLGRSGRPDAVNKLVPLLKDKHVALAAAAARGLGLAGDVRAVPALTALLDENFPELREAACEALGRLGDPSSLPRLLTLAQEKSPTSAFAARAMLSMPPSPEVDKALCELVLTGPDTLVVTVGRELRRRNGCPTEPLVERLKNPTTASQALLAIVALGGGPADLTARVAPYVSSTDEALRRLSIEALAELGDPAGAPHLLKAWEAELKVQEPRRQDWVPAELPRVYSSGFDPSQAPIPDDPFTVTRARTSDLLARVQALDAQRAKERGKTLLESRPPREVLDDSPDDEARVLAVLLRALGKLRVDGAREKILPFTTDNSPMVRGAAWSGLAFLGEDARPALFDAERAVQAAVAQALVEAGPAGQVVVVNALDQLAGDRTRLLEPLRPVVLPSDAAPALERLLVEGGAEAGTAARLLAEMRATSAVPALVKLLSDSETVARREVLLALGRLGDEKVAPLIAKDLFSDSAEVRSAAARALAALKAPTHLDALDALTGDYDRQVRESARAALDVLAPSAKSPQEVRP